MIQYEVRYEATTELHLPTPFRRASRLHMLGFAKQQIQQIYEARGSVRLICEVNDRGNYYTGEVRGGNFNGIANRNACSAEHGITTAIGAVETSLRPGTLND
jgi:hypothetical protein